MIDNKDISKIRRDYKQKTLSELEISPNPFEQFNIWLNDALNADIIDPNAMSVATVDHNNIPSIRTVLLKDISKDGFTFFTNYKSKKALDIDNNSNVALHFFWRELERQVLIKGTAVKISHNASKEYFNTRPYESKIAAIVSPQSEVIPARNFLEEKFNSLQSKNNPNIDCPDYWGGYKVTPEYFEFWQGRENRLHDRICYIYSNNNWNIKRLAP